jgi:geranylgeranyl diphosphate synthase type I
MFSRYKNSVEQELNRVVPTAHNSETYRLLRYHLGWVDQQGTPMDTSVSQGKALRPTLCLFACEALASEYSRALPAAAALELIHNFSLIHDDIQDQDMERRHQPTVWHLWGIPKAIWSGNAMQCTGDLSLLDVARANVPAVTAIRVSDILTESYLEMIQGQCMDLDFESRTDIKSEEYLYMIACKTGALIRSALQIGALLATEDPATVKAFTEFGNHLGQAFQVRDDYLGIWGDQATLGKATGNDIRRRKKSYPVVFALERASGQAMADLLRIYRQEELEECDVQRVMAVLDEVGSQEQAQRVTEAAAGRALAALKPVSLPQWAQTEAENLVDFLARREY